MKLIYKIVTIIITIIMLTYVVVFFCNDKLRINNIETEVAFFNEPLDKEKIDKAQQNFEENGCFVEDNYISFESLDYRQPKDNEYGGGFAVKITAECKIPLYFDHRLTYCLDKCKLNGEKKNMDIFFGFVGDALEMKFYDEIEEEYFDEDGYFKGYDNSQENEDSSNKDKFNLIISNDKKCKVTWYLYGATYGKSREEILDIVEDIEIDIESLIYNSNIEQESLFEKKIKSNDVEVIEKIEGLPNI